MIICDVKKVLQSSGGQLHMELTCTLKENTLTVVYGDSGAGKTSLLRMIAGLMNPDSGTIRCHDELWFDSSNNTNLRTQDRNIGFVFQDQALFPNMTMRKNLLYALRDKKRQDTVDEILHLFELEGLQDQFPNTLSGGQKQKVSLARAIVNKPKILLLDEPLSALDQRRRSRFQDFILKSHQEYNLTTIMVSHDQREINKMADQVLLLEDGKIVKKNEAEGETFQEATVVNIPVQNDKNQVQIKLKQSNPQRVKELKKGDKIWISRKEH